MRLVTVDEKIVSVQNLVCDVMGGFIRRIGINDRIIIDFKQQEIVMDVIGVDADGPETITLQTHNVLSCVTEYDDNMSFRWQQSSLRRALNEQSVIDELEASNPGLSDMIIPRACKELTDGSTDRIFILSEDEINGEPYEYYNKRYHKTHTPIKIDDKGECRGYWLRSASESRGAGTWYYGTGYINRAVMGMKYAVAPCFVVGYAIAKNIVIEKENA